MEINFKCPTKRSSLETGGLYSILVASLIPNDEISNVVVNS